MATSPVGRGSLPVEIQRDIATLPFHSANDMPQALNVFRYLG
jgi:hypothetical protein